MSNSNTTLILFGVAVVALLIGGIAVNHPTPTPVTTTVATPQKSLEMLGPVYSEKGIYQDDAIHVSFKALINSANQVESRIPMWLHNMSADAIVLEWDRCSLQLPNGNTVHVVPAAWLTTPTPVPHVITIAPGGDLFATLIPVTEIKRATDGTYTVSTGVLDQGPFFLTLAIETAGNGCPRTTRYYSFRLIIR